MKKLIIVILLTGLVVGCGAQKKLEQTDSTTKETVKVEEKKDSATTVKVNQAIDDKITTKVEETGDPYLDAKIDEALAKLNSQKSSGSNSYKFYYDRLKRELKAEFTVGATKDSISITSKERTEERSFETEMNTYIKKTFKKIPWWVFAIVIYLFRHQIFGALSFFIPGLGAIRSINDIIPRRRHGNQ